MFETESVMHNNQIINDQQQFWFYIYLGLRLEERTYSKIVLPQTLR